MDNLDNLPSVKIIEVCKVGPPPPPEEDARATAVDAVAPPPTSLPLTFFDLLWLRFHPIQRLFFYELLPISHDDDDICFVDVVVPKLKTSLSLALAQYLPLAGNLLWPPNSDVPSVEFVDGDGVLLTVAESDADFYHLCSDGFREVSEFHPLVPQLPASHHHAAVIAIQITRFQNKGFSIGVTNHHAIMDGRTSTSFIKSWAQICNNGDQFSTTKLMPFYDRSVIDDPKGLTKIYANAWMNKEGPNNKSLNLKLPKPQPDLIRSTFEFKQKNIQKLRQWILNKKKDDQSHDHYISSFALATAYLCVCTAKLEQRLRSSDDNENIVFAFAADARSRLSPPVPTNYFGNCLVAGFTSIERIELLGENGMLVAAEAISKAIEKLGEEALNGAENWGSLMSEMTNDYSKAAHVISLSGSPRFGVYDANFGWGKPMKVEIVSAESPMVFALTDGRNSDVGMEIGVVKKRDEMECFAAIFHEGFQCL